jgi:hypothetical protein
MLSQAIQIQTANGKRWISLFLLVFIVYGTTVEAAHRHGRVAPAAAAAASFTQTGSQNSTLRTTPGCSDCLICQLHQNFSATLISFKPVAEHLSRVTHSRQSITLPVHSIAHNPKSGRAPPKAN